MNDWKKLSRLCAVWLILNAAWVAWRIFTVGQAWIWIVIYWIIVTFKNLCDLMAALKK